MDDFPGLLARDFGFRAQGKAAPMAASKSTSSTGGTLNFGIGSGGEGGRSSSFSSSSQRGGKSSWNSTPVGTSFLDDDNLFRSSGSQKMHDFDGLGGGGGGGGGYNDVYGGPPKYANQSDTRKTSTSFDYDSIFQQGAGGGNKLSAGGGAKSSSPVYDKPVYDDDIFDGVPGMKSTSSVNYDDVFSTISSPPKQNDHYDLLGNFGKNDPPQSKSSVSKRSQKVNKDTSDFGDLIPGFGGSSPPKKRGTPETSQPQQSAVPSNRSKNVMEDILVDLEPSSAPAYESPEIFSDQVEQINNVKKPDTKFNGSSSGVFDDLNPLDDLVKPVPTFSSGPKSRVDDRSPSRTGRNATSTRKAASDEPTEDSFYRTSTSASPKVDMSPTAEVNLDSADDIWITVSEVPLFTHPTSAPPPSRPPPPKPVQVSKSRHTKEKVNEYSSFQNFSPSFQSPTSVPSSGRNMGVSSIDELEDFARGTSRDHTDERADVLSSEEEVDTNSAAAASAAAMKEAMDKAEAKFKHAKEVRERENARTGRNREAAEQEKDERALRDAQEREMREKQERLDREREQREREERDRERRRLEKERERARQAVERATREARERAAAEARQRAEKAAVEKATAEARTRAERAAVQKAQAEARERAAAEARERAERAAAEARERSTTEARERASVARAEAEVRARSERASVERAAAEARERAAAAARENQQNNENDLESFFNMGHRASSAPRPNRTANSDSAFTSQFQNRPVPEGVRKTSSGTSSTIRKASSTTNIVDDLTSIFGPSSSGEFQDIDGESEERRRARLERHQRTQERAAKALAEKNERDRQTQNEQAERHRFAETLDVEIKRWSAGKEGNLRALLSTLQYVLWPECGWQPVSLTDLITGASVKKVYRKATLCIHPDKVQQKGANLQQKYIAEKVFDLMKEAWNKFNSEELF